MIGINIEMPKACIKCPFQYRHYDGFVYVCQLQNDAISDVTTKDKGCPLIEIKRIDKETHGSADAVQGEWLCENERR